MLNFKQYLTLVGVNPISGFMQSVSGMCPPFEIMPPPTASPSWIGHRLAKLSYANVCVSSTYSMSYKEFCSTAILQ